MPAADGLKEALGPVARSLVDRHLANAREWFPHEYVPWERARAFDPGYRWDEADSVTKMVNFIRDGDHGLEAIYTQMIGHHR